MINLIDISELKFEQLAKELILNNIPLAVQFGTTAGLICDGTSQRNIETLLELKSQGAARIKRPPIACLINTSDLFELGVVDEERLHNIIPHDISSTKKILELLEGVAFVRLPIKVELWRYSDFLINLDTKSLQYISFRGTPHESAMEKFKTLYRDANKSLIQIIAITSLNPSGIASAKSLEETFTHCQSLGIETLFVSVKDNTENTEIPHTYAIIDFTEGHSAKIVRSGNVSNKEILDLLPGISIVNESEFLFQNFAGDNLFLEAKEKKTTIISKL